MHFSVHHFQPLLAEIHLFVVFLRSWNLIECNRAKDPEPEFLAIKGETILISRYFISHWLNFREVTESGSEKEIQIIVSFLASMNIFYFKIFSLSLWEKTMSWILLVYPWGCITDSSENLCWCELPLTWKATGWINWEHRDGARPFNCQLCHILPVFLSNLLKN